MSCASTSKSTSNSANQSEELKSLEELTHYNDLVDYLRRVPGLQYTEGYFRIRGPQSNNDYTEPLYVIDGVLIGNSLDRANSLVDPMDIDRVVVLKDVGSTNQYGMRGANGVIQIFTKKD